MRFALNATRPPSHLRALWPRLRAEERERGHGRDSTQNVRAVVEAQHMDTGDALAVAFLEATDEQRPTARRHALVYLVLALLLAAGCTTSRTRWGDPDRSPATKVDMKNYVHDSYECVRESEQEIRFGQLPSSRQRDAQLLYERCMTARGYDVQRR